MELATGKTAMAEERERCSLRAVGSGAVGSGPWLHGPGGSGAFDRRDRTLRFERQLGRALWLLLAIVLLWIGLS